MNFFVSDAECLAGSPGSGGLTYEHKVFRSCRNARQSASKVKTSIQRFALVPLVRTNSSDCASALVPLMVLILQRRFPDRHREQCHKYGRDSEYSPKFHDWPPKRQTSTLKELSYGMNRARSLSLPTTFNTFRMIRVPGYTCMLTSVLELVICAKNAPNCAFCTRFRVSCLQRLPEPLVAIGRSY
jgi:hypothetical protein